MGRSSAMFVNSRTWNAGKDATPASTHISTKTTKMNKFKKTRRPLTSTSAIAISRTMPVGRIATGKRTKKKRTMGQITTEKIITEKTKKKKTMGQITMERTKNKKTMGQITTERIT